jgi:putative transposase
MGIPYRGRTGQGTYFITASTFLKQNLLQSDRMAQLFIDVLKHYQEQKAYRLHEFVVMPDHFHLLITPNTSLERSMQLIKGGFSFRAKRELEFGAEIWQTSFYDRRVRDADEYERFRLYIHTNPVRRGLAPKTDEYPYSSAVRNFLLDDVPPRLKPVFLNLG